MKLKFTKILSGWILILILVAVLQACGGGPVPQEGFGTDTGIKYEVFYVQGMPCVYAERGSGRTSATGGPSCDWSKWPGE